jgi:hypothetical protein
MENENFDQLKKLLALKKHEQPPPGYFNSFSSKVIARIQAEEQAQAKPWWQRFLAFNVRPVMAGVYGLAAVGILGFMISANKPGQDSAPVTAKKPVVSHPQVNEASATVPLDNAPNNSIVLASNDAAPSFLFNPNGVFNSNTPYPRPMPANYQQIGE